MTVKEMKAGAGVPRIGLLLLSHNRGLCKNEAGADVSPYQLFLSRCANNNGNRILVNAEQLQQFS